MNETMRYAFTHEDLTCLIRAVKAQTEWNLREGVPDPQDADYIEYLTDKGLSQMESLREECQRLLTGM